MMTMMNNDFMQQMGQPDGIMDFLNQAPNMSGAPQIGGQLGGYDSLVGYGSDANSGGGVQSYMNNVFAQNDNLGTNGIGDIAPYMRMMQNNPQQAMQSPMAAPRNGVLGSGLNQPTGSNSGQLQQGQIGAPTQSQLSGDRGYGSMANYGKIG